MTIYDTNTEKHINLIFVLLKRALTVNTTVALLNPITILFSFSVEIYEGHMKAPKHPPTSVGGFLMLFVPRPGPVVSQTATNL